MKSSFDIEQVLAEHGPNSAVIRYDEWLSQITNHGQQLDVLSSSQRVFFLNQQFEKEINNGGFEQFFCNSTGDFAYETVASLRSIGAEKTATMLEAAINQFPNGQVSKDRLDRLDAMESLRHTLQPFFEVLDSRFFEYEDDLNILLLWCCCSANAVIIIIPLIAYSFSLGIRSKIFLKGKNRRIHSLKTFKDMVIRFQINIG